MTVIKKSKKKTESKEVLEVIARGFFIFSFFVIPLFVGLVLSIIVANQNKYINNKIKDIVEIMVTQMGYVHLNDFFSFIPPMSVYAALSDLFKDRLSNYQLSKDKLMIIHKEGK